MPDAVTREALLVPSSRCSATQDAPTAIATETAIQPGFHITGSVKRSADMPR